MLFFDREIYLFGIPDSSSGLSLISQTINSLLDSSTFYHSTTPSWLKHLSFGISHKMGRRFLRRGTCTFSSSGTAIYGVSLIHNQLGLDALVDCFKN